MDDKLITVILDAFKYADKEYYKLIYKQDIVIGIRNLILQNCIKQCQEFGWSKGSENYFICDRGIFKFSINKDILTERFTVNLIVFNPQEQENTSFQIFPYFSFEDKKYYNFIQTEIKILWDRYTYMKELHGTDF